MKNIYLIFKRIFDIILAFIGLIVAFPICLIIAILIKVTSEGPIIFKQERIGKDGKIFKMYKFRTMIQNAENLGSGVYSDKNDSRVTKVGKILRKTSLDEIPQMINIIKGNMSFIGPRPVLTYHPWTYDKYTTEQLKRFSVRPGLTGWAQVHGRKTVEWNNRLKYDVYYVEHLSFFLDLNIFFMTIKQVITSEGNENIGKTVKDKE